jgi:hypothetical protein
LGKFAEYTGWMKSQSRSGGWIDAARAWATSQKYGLCPSSWPNSSKAGAGHQMHKLIDWQAFGADFNIPNWFAIQSQVKQKVKTLVVERMGTRKLWDVILLYQVRS